MIKKVLVRQDGLKECGSACLESIIKYYGGNIPTNRILELTNTTNEGTSFYNLKEAALEIGLAAKAYQIDDIDKLKEIDKPFISQIVVNNCLHFVVIYKMKDGVITVMDPAKGMVKMYDDELSKRWTGYILVLEPYRELPFYEENNYLSEIIGELIYKNKRMLINILLLSLITTIFTYIYSSYFKIIINYIIETNNHNLRIVSLIFLVIVLVKVITNYLRNSLLLYFNQKFDLSIVTSTVKKILLLSLSYYKHKTTGEVISRISDLMYIKNVTTKIITTVLGDLLLSIGAIVILFSINKSMTLILLVIAAIYFLLFLIYKPIIRRMTTLNQENNAKFNRLLVESISGYESIKGLNLENTFGKKINSTYFTLTSDNLRFTKWLNLGEFIKDITQNGLILLIIYLGVNYVMTSKLELGDLITYNTILYYFLTPMRNTFSLYHEIYYAKNSLKRINNLLNYEGEVFSKKKNLLMTGGIYFKHLTFSYSADKTILKDITLEIKPAEKVLILGKSGHGKSTLLKLIYRYYQVKRDMLFINGYDINDFSLSDIRENIVYISQNEFLYSDTIRTNILLDRKVSEEFFLKICHITHVDEIVRNKLQGYDFRLEENGSNLSGGERKRIILARAMLKNSQIVLIDEGFNEIDMVMERDILTKLFNLFPSKLFMIVSHRTNNMDLYSKVIKLKDGKIVEGLNRYVG